jgi:hypothetical protein
MSSSSSQLESRENSPPVALSTNSLWADRECLLMMRERVLRHREEAHFERLFVVLMSHSGKLKQFGQLCSTSFKYSKRGELVPLRIGPPIKYCL